MDEESKPKRARAGAAKKRTKRGKVISSYEEGKAFLLAPAQLPKMDVKAVDEVKAQGPQRGLAPPTNLPTVKPQQAEAEDSRFEELRANWHLGQIEALVSKEFKRIDDWIPSLKEWLKRRIPEVTSTDYTVPEPPGSLPYSPRLEPMVVAVRNAADVIRAYRAFVLAQAQWLKAGQDLLAAHARFEGLPLDVKRVVRKFKSELQLAVAFSVVGPNAGGLSPDKLKALAQQVGHYPQHVELENPENLPANAVVAQAVATRRMESLKSVLRTVRANGLLRTLEAAVRRGSSTPTAVPDGGQVDAAGNSGPEGGHK